MSISYGCGGTPSRFAPLAKLYRSSTAHGGHSGEHIKISVGAFGLIAPTKKEAMERFYPGWLNLKIEMGKLRGWPAPEKSHFDALVEAPRAYNLGDPDEIAGRIVDLYRHLRQMRHFLQMDIGGLPHKNFRSSPFAWCIGVAA